MEGFSSIIQALRDVEDKIDTVFSLGVISRVDEDGNSQVMPQMQALGLEPVRGKVNVGLGRPLVMD